MVNKLKRKIAIITGSRAEYGLLFWLMREIQKDSDLQLQIIVTGMHLAPEFGLTYHEIIADGFTIDAKIESQLSSDSRVGVAKSVGLGIIGFADAFQHLQPDIIVLLGDRFEILAAAQAALFANIPIAHLYGGEITEGAFDDSIRHCITKMSTLHFAGCKDYLHRIVQLGEEPARVFNVGYTAIDYISHSKLLDKKSIEKELNFFFGKNNFLVTYHPTTLVSKPVEEGFNQLLEALNYFSETSIIFTKANSDPGGRKINTMIEQYIKQHENCTAISNLGSLKYLSCIQQVDVVIGNSSSGIIEVPYFKKPTVNIGIRQKGRLRPNSVIDCEDESTSSIINAIQCAIKKIPELKKDSSPLLYGTGQSSVKIKEILKSFNFSKDFRKKFHDIRISYDC